MSSAFWLRPFVAALAFLPAIGFAQAIPVVRWAADHHDAYNRSMAVSPDQQLVALGSADAEVRIFTNTAGIYVRELFALNDVSAVAFSPDARTMAYGSSDRHLYVADAYTGANHWTIPTAGTVTGVRFSRDGQRVFFADEAGYVTCLAINGRLIWRLRPTETPQRCMAINASGDMIAVGGDDKNIRVYRTSDGYLRYTLTGHADKIIAMAFSPDAKYLYAGDYDCNVRKWTLASSAYSNLYAPPSKVLYDLALSPDGTKLAVLRADKVVATVSNTGTLIRTDTLEVDTYALAYLSSTRIGMCGEASGLITYDANSYAVTDRWMTAGDAPNTVAWKPNAQTVASSDDRTLTLWNATTSRSAYKATFAATILSMAYSPNGAYLAVGLQNGEIHVLQTSDYVAYRILSDGMGAVSSLDWSPDSNLLASGSNDQFVRLWLMSTGVRAFKQDMGAGTAPNHVALTKTGKILAVGGLDGIVRAFNVTATNTLTPRYELATFAEPIKDLEFSPNSVYLAVAANDKVYLRNASAGTEIKGLAQAGGVLNRIGFSTDGLKLFGLPKDNYIMTMWPVGVGSDVQFNLGANNRGLAFSPAGDAMALSTDYGGNVMVIGVPNKTVLGALVPYATAVPGGQAVPVGLQLTGYAPSVGVPIVLTSNSANAVIPSGIVIPYGYSYGEVWVQTLPVASPTTAWLTANSGSTTMQIPLLIVPPAIKGFTISPPTLKGGESATLKVVLTSPAPAAGATVTLRTTSSKAPVPATIVVPPGATEATATITTLATTASVNVVISASYRYATLRANLIVTP